MGYLIGSIPTAFLFVKWKSRVDIRTVGSGNVGTLNSYEVTNSKLVGVAVLLLDLLKGAAGALVPQVILGNDFLYGAVGGIAVVLGHNFPVWLRFKGGRGLAPAAGVFFVIGWAFVAMWCVLWGIGFALFKKVNIGNVLASLIALLFIVVAPGSILDQMLSSEVVIGQFRIFGAILLSIVLVKHIEPVRDFIEQRRFHN
jgi:acyl phosphate:glycerol-3-phosphate acyltransferase